MTVHQNVGVYTFFEFPKASPPAPLTAPIFESKNYVILIKSVMKLQNIMCGPLKGISFNILHTVNGWYEPST